MNRGEKVVGEATNPKIWSNITQGPPFHRTYWS